MANPPHMRRVWYKDGTYMDVQRMHAWEYEGDPEWDHTEDLTEEEDVDAADSE